MKNILIMFLALGSVVMGQTDHIVNLTSPSEKMNRYGFDFTDTDGDGMTDVAERKYGFNPNDSNSFPNKDYTFLAGNEPTLHESTGVLDPLNEIRFQFTESEYETNRKGESNLEKLKLDREFLNLAMPILLDELGSPPESFIVKISCLNRGVYANGTRISVMDDSRPQSFIHEIGHVWKYGWTYNFMKLRGGNRTNFRGFEEGFSEALTYIICNKFAEAYPTHPLVEKWIVTGKNAQTYRGNVYNFDVTLGAESLQGGTFWKDKFTEYRYENSAGVFTVLANQRDGAMRDLLRVFYKNAEDNPSWDWTLNAQDLHNLWEEVLPQVNGIDTSDWLSYTRLLDGKSATQKLYVSIIDHKVYLLYPDRQGNFSWSYDANMLSHNKIPTWFPKKESSGKFVPNVSNQPFNVEVKTIHGEVARQVSKTTGTRALGETSISEIYKSYLPIGLYNVEIEFPNFKAHTTEFVNSSYVIGTQHIKYSKDELTLQVGIDAPTAKQVEMKINGATYESNYTNGLALFRFADVGIDHTGPIEIIVSNDDKTQTYKRVVSHFGTSSGYRMNEFLIVDRDFDGVEDAFDESVIAEMDFNYVKFSEIETNAVALANPLTRKKGDRVVKINLPPAPKLGNPLTPPVNPIDVLETEISNLRGEVDKLKIDLSTAKLQNQNLVVENENLTKTKNDLSAKLDVLESSLVELNNVILQKDLANVQLASEIDSLTKKVIELVKEKFELHQKVNQLTSSLNDAELLVKQKEASNTKISDDLTEKNNKIIELTSIVEENNETIVRLTEQVQDFNSSLVKLRNQLSDEQNGTTELKTNNANLVSENDDLKSVIAQLKSQLEVANKSNEELVVTNTNLQNSTSVMQNNVGELTNTNLSLMTSLDESNIKIDALTSELEEAIRVAQVPFTSGWFFDPEDGWLYTDADTFPLVYKHSNKTWYFYELGSHNSRYFFSYETQEWEEWK